MPTVWFALKRSLQCKSEPSEVSCPRRKSSFLRSGCSRSIANLKDVVIHGSKRNFERPPSCSPRSIGSSDFVNPISHQVFVSRSTCELKISGFHGGGGGEGRGGSSPAAAAAPPPPRMAKKASFPVGCSGDSGHRCHKCGEKFGKWEVLETHHLSRHAVTELGENDSSRKIVEIICRSSKGDPIPIHRVLKLHNLPKTLATFEDHRQAVKLRAAKLPTKHPRCLADGNELLRFHAAPLRCSLPDNPTAVCSSDDCRLCRIIRRGFSPAADKPGGVFTASTSGRALQELAGEAPADRRALLLCRVIAGRVHRPVEDLKTLPELAGFDSLAGKLGLHANIEELYLFNPRALLPCFVVIFKS